MSRDTPMPKSGGFPMATEYASVEDVFGIHAADSKLKLNHLRPVGA